MVKFNAKNILTIIEAIVSVIVGGLVTGIADFPGSHYGTVYGTQVIDFVVYGFIIYNLIHLITIFAFDKELPKPTRIMYASSGFILWLAACAIIFTRLNLYQNTHYPRALAAALLALLESILYAVDVGLTVGLPDDIQHETLS